jgi:hypothetical protein
MSAPNCHCNNEYQGRLTGMADQHRVAWRNALAILASPIVRLHELRNARTRMLHEALRNQDHCGTRNRDA